MTGAPVELARLFLAAWPPIDVVEGLASLPRPDEAGVRWIPADNWHVTLRFVGRSALDDVRHRLDGLELPAARARLGPAVGRLGRDGVVVPVAGLDVLAAAVTEATRDVGQRPDDRPFTGHVTLARLRRGSVRCGLVGHRFDAEFAVAEVVLARSTLAPTGARYDVVASWPTI